MKFTLSNNHIVVNIEGNNYVIDTGLSMSISFKRNASVLINSHKYALITVSSTGQFSKVDIDRLVGLEVDGFIGTDIVNNHGLTIDYENSEVEFGCSRTDSDLIEIPILNNGYIVIPNVTLNGIRTSSTVLDTGAYKSVAKSMFFKPSDDTGAVYNDYNFGIKWFNGTLYRATFSIGEIFSKELLFEPKDAHFGQYDSFICPKDLSDKLVIIDVKDKVLKVKK